MTVTGTGFEPKIQKTIDASTASPRTPSTTGGHRLGPAGSGPRSICSSESLSILSFTAIFWVLLPPAASPIVYLTLQAYKNLSQNSPWVAFLGPHSRTLVQYSG